MKCEGCGKPGAPDFMILDDRPYCPTCLLQMYKTMKRLDTTFHIDVENGSLVTRSRHESNS